MPTADRHFSNGGGEVVINGHRCPIIGNICMDACMIDVTDTDAHEGDSVIIFGEELPVSELSDKLKTIPYEILTSISPRVKECTTGNKYPGALSCPRLEGVSCKRLRILHIFTIFVP